ncbi:hypothetical protein D3C84_949720 [compost metagenome]
MGLVDIHPEGIRVLLQHRLGALGEVAGVLGHVLRGDRELRLLVLERIAAAPARHIAGGGCGQPAGPGRDGAVLVARLLGAEGSQLALQTLRLIGRHGGMAGGCNDTGQQRQTFTNSKNLVHRYLVVLVVVTKPLQKLYFAVKATKSRSLRAC